MPQAEQTTLFATGSSEIDEHGKRDEYDRGGVYDAAGALDLDATKELLRERFQPVSNRLPDSVGEFERADAREGYMAKYVSDAQCTGIHGIEASQRIVRIFPRGPYLNDWRVEVRERHPEYATNEHNGWASWLHQDTPGLNSPGAAVATALGVMRDRIPKHHSKTDE